jgi:hypothetical protein
MVGLTGEMETWRPREAAVQQLRERLPRLSAIMSESSWVISLGRTT